MNFLGLQDKHVQISESPANHFQRYNKIRKINVHLLSPGLLKGVIKETIGKLRCTSHVCTGRLGLQDCLLCKSIWLALHVDCMCVESLWYICCHHDHLLPP